MVKCGVIGYGAAFDMGKWHGVWMERAGMELAAVCDTDATRLAAAAEQFPGVATCSDYHEMLADPAIEVVAVVLPHRLHEAVTVASLIAGKHTIVEKPMCLTAGEADGMIEASLFSGKTLSVFHNRRWDGDFRAITGVVESGRIGEVFQIECSFGAFEPHKDWWRSDKETSGGTLYDFGAHMVDWILNLVPSSVENVTGAFVAGVWKGAKSEDHTRATIKFANGCCADVEVSQLKSVNKPKWRILGTRGGITADWGPSITVNEWDGSGLATAEIECGDDDWGAFYRNFNAFLKGEEDLAVKPDQARRAIAVIEAAEESHRIGRAVAPAYK